MAGTKKGDWKIWLGIAATTATALLIIGLADGMPIGRATWGSLAMVGCLTIELLPGCLTELL